MCLLSTAFVYVLNHEHPQPFHYVSAFSLGILNTLFFILVLVTLVLLVVIGLGLVVTCLGCRYSSSNLQHD